MTKTTETVVTEESEAPQPEGDVTVIAVTTPPMESSSSNQTTIELMDRIQAVENLTASCRADLSAEIQSLREMIYRMQEEAIPKESEVTLVEPEVLPVESKAPKAAKSMLGRALLGG